MILHPYTHGDAIVANYYGHGFGSIFARLFSKVAAKTASRAALSAAKRVGSRLVKTGVRKVMPIAKKTITSAVKTGIKKAAPIAKKILKKGVKRVAEEAQSAIANKVRKVEELAIKKGVSPELAHTVSTSVVDGSQAGIDDLSNLVYKGKSKTVAKIPQRSSKKVTRIGKKGLHSKRLKSRIKLITGRKGRKRRIASEIQNLIDSA